MRRTLGVCLVAGSLLGAACTTEQSSTPAPTLTSTTSIATTTTTTTTSPATTTTAPATTTTETPESTLPAGPSNGTIPLLIGGGEAGWLPLGVWQVDEWVAAPAGNDEPIEASIEPGGAFTASNLDGQSVGAVGETVEACFDGREGPMLDVSLTAPEPPGYGYAAVALPTSDWPLVPRPVAVTATGPVAYADLAVASLDGEPVDASLGSIEQLVVADLDGDGDDEALVVYEFVQPSAGPGAPGDLTTVLLVDTATRNATTVVQSFVDKGLGPDEFPLIERFRILDVADYNGDGRMEVAIHAWYYEGASVVVYEYDGAELVEALANGCGA